MLIRIDGSIADTIGGGTIEHLCIQDAVKLLHEDEPRPFIKEYILSNENAAGIGMWCGGAGGYTVRHRLKNRKTELKKQSQRGNPV